LASAAEVRLAVATNFHAATQELASEFERTTGHSTRISYGSTGKLYAQIVQGAPFDVFLAADHLRPERLVKEGLAEPGTRFTYAVGRLVLWSPQPEAITDPEIFLTARSSQRLAIANPATAPYGLAAQQVLQKLGLWEKLGPALVRGESIAQTFQFVATGNARGGFVAAAQLVDRNQKGSAWMVPANMHQPIAQQAVLLDRGRNNAAARAWMAFLKTPDASATIRSHGYDLVNHP